MIPAASMIQVWTLVVAGVAAAAGLIGIFYNAYSTRKAEHETWQRDLRLRLYSECSNQADVLLKAIIALQIDLPDALRHGPGSRVSDLQLELGNKVSEIETFGATRVAEAGRALIDGFGETTRAQLALVVASREVNRGQNGQSKEEFYAGLRLVTACRGDFLQAVRESMKISDQ